MALFQPSNYNMVSLKDDFRKVLNNARSLQDVQCTARGWDLTISFFISFATFLLPSANQKHSACLNTL